MIKRLLKKLVIASVLSIFLFAGGLTYFLRIPSNIEFLFGQDSELLLRGKDKWVKLKDSNKEEVISTIFIASEVTVSQAIIRRSRRKAAGRLKDVILPNKILIFEFSPSNIFRLIVEDPFNLNPLNASQALKSDKFNFVINTSFYGLENEHIGELILKGERISSETSRSSGFFKVIDGQPRTGPRSIFKDLQGQVSYSCQAHPSVMRNGIIFHYIISEQWPYLNSWGKKTYRNLIGEKSNGNIVFILSNRGALLTVKEISQLAAITGIQNASLFDGGSALQYKFSYKSKRIRFSAFNNSLNPGKRIENYILRRKGIRPIQKSPVYLGVRIQE